MCQNWALTARETNVTKGITPWSDSWRIILHEANDERLAIIVIRRPHAACSKKACANLWRADRLVRSRHDISPVWNASGLQRPSGFWTQPVAHGAAGYIAE